MLTLGVFNARTVFKSVRWNVSLSSKRKKRSVSVYFREFWAYSRTEIE